MKPPMPDGPVVVYDGSCGFCRYMVTRLAAGWHLPGERVAWQRADLDALGLTEAQVRDRLWYLQPGKPPAGGAAAFAGWLAGGDRTARLISVVLRTPGVTIAAAAAYRIVARHRHRIPGPWERTCAI